MSKELPEKIAIDCINSECSNQIILSLSNKNYSNTAYVGDCSRCALVIRIHKYSPFIERLAEKSNITFVSPLRKISLAQEVHKDNPNFLK